MAVSVASKRFAPLSGCHIVLIVQPLHSAAVLEIVQRPDPSGCTRYIHPANTATRGRPAAASRRSGNRDFCGCRWTSAATT